MVKGLDPRSFFVVPAAQDVGPRAVSWGWSGRCSAKELDVGYAKPIATPEATGAEVDLSCHFARTLCHLDVTEPISFAEAEERVRAGQLSELMEDVVTIAETAGAAHDVVIIQGIALDSLSPLALQLNIAMAGCLSARMVLVVKASGRTAAQLSEDIASSVRLYSDGGRNAFAGVVLNQVAADDEGARLVAAVQQREGQLPLLAAVPFDARLHAPRLADVAEELGLTVERAGDMARARVQDIAVAGSAVENAISWLRPGTLLVTSGDRSDIILATALAYLRGIPLAGMLLTCGRRPAPSVAALISTSQLNGLPILCSDKDTYGTSMLLAGLNRHVTRNDPERMEQAIRLVADGTDTALLKAASASPARSA